MEMYNATAYKLDVNGKVVSTEAVELDENGTVIRSCGHWSPWSGKPEFEAVWRSGFMSFVADVRIERDGAAGYRNRLRKLALPATYTEGVA